VGARFVSGTRVLARGRRWESTIPNPLLPNRGDARMIAGRNGEIYYTPDHYKSFR